jgi:putative heme-binding domain-containing protein
VKGGDLLRARDAAQQLAQANLDPAQVRAVAEALPAVKGAPLSALLEVFRAHRDAPTTEILLAALAKLDALPAPVVRSVLSGHSQPIRDAADALLQKRGGANAGARLDELAAVLPKGDARRGHLLFQSPRSACTTCHAMAYTGGTFGPDLTRIGPTRSERDLLEAIVFPSMSFVRSYEPVLVKTKSGADQLGIVKSETREAIVLATGPQTQARIDRSEITALDPAPISLMPQGYDGIFNPQELADLVAFLKAAK